MTTDYGPTTALVVVDVQNDFADPNGSLYVQGGDAVVEVVNGEIEAAAAAGGYVVYTQDWHPPTTPHFIDSGGVWPVHCVRDTWGAELHPGLEVVGPVVRKGTGGEDGYSGFTVRDPETDAESVTELDALLRDRGIDRVVVVGLAFDVCVKATAIDGENNGYAVTVLKQASASVNLEPDDEERAEAELVYNGIQVV